MPKKEITCILAAACLISSIALTTPVYAAPADLPRTGQAQCFDSAGAAVDCANTGQDGELQKGLSWPSPRFTNADGSAPISGAGNTVVDQLTGLMWTKDGDGPGPDSCILATTKTKTWQDALDYVECLNSISFLGFSDWRMPNVHEMDSLLNLGQQDTSVWLNAQGFVHVQGAAYWTSTTLAVNPNGAWGVDMLDGSVLPINKVFAWHVWPVRAGQ